MRILQNLQDKMTGMRGRSLARLPVSADVIERETGEVRPYEISHSTEHELVLKLRVTYWANQAQVSGEREIAERMLVSLLYSDLLVKLDEVSYHIMNGDCGAAHKAIAALRAEVTR